MNYDLLMYFDLSESLKMLDDALRSSSESKSSLVVKKHTQLLKYP